MPEPTLGQLREFLARILAIRRTPWQKDWGYGLQELIDNSQGALALLARSWAYRVSLREVSDLLKNEKIEGANRAVLLARLAELRPTSKAALLEEARRIVAVGRPAEVAVAYATVIGIDPRPEEHDGLEGIVLSFYVLQDVVRVLIEFGRIDSARYLVDHVVNNGGPDAQEYCAEIRMHLSRETAEEGFLKGIIEQAQGCPACWIFAAACMPQYSFLTENALVFAAAEAARGNMDNVLWLLREGVCTTDWCYSVMAGHHKASEVPEGEIVFLLRSSLRSGRTLIAEYRYSELGKKGREVVAIEMAIAMAREGNFLLALDALTYVVDRREFDRVTAVIAAALIAKGRVTEAFGLLPKREEDPGGRALALLRIARGIHEVFR